MNWLMDHIGFLLSLTKAFAVCGPLGVIYIKVFLWHSLSGWWLLAPVGPYAITVIGGLILFYFEKELTE